MTQAIGTQLLAPQARLVDLDSGSVVGATSVTAAQGAAGTPTAVIAPDIVSARVTLLNTGIGQLQITLNNQRFVDGKPHFPPWKYNDFSSARPHLATGSGVGGIRFGQKLRLDLRYGHGSWIKMISVQVTDLEFGFHADTGADLKVTGEDLLSLLKVKPDQDKRYDRRQEEDIVSEVLNAVFKSSRPTFTPAAGARSREGRSQPLSSLRQAKTVTYFQFLQSLADRLDYEMALEFKNVVAASDASVGQAAAGPLTPATELQFRFEPARSGAPPIAQAQDGLEQADGSFHYVLRWGRSLIEFTPKFKAFDVPTQADASGTTPGRRARSTQSLSPAEMNALLQGELPLSPNYQGLTMKTATEARKTYFGAVGVNDENNESSAGTNLDDARLKRQAVSRFMKRAREFLTADAQVIGLPKLRPGQYVDIVGFRPPFDGYYYVTKTVHLLDRTGYRTTLSLRRPGMLPPERYLDLPTQSASPAPNTP